MIWRIVVVVVGLAAWLGVGLTASAATSAATQTLTKRQYLPLIQRKWSGELVAPAPIGVSDRTGTAVGLTPILLELARQAGTTYNRTSVSWKQIESSNVTPAQYNWTETDKKLDALLNGGPIPFVLILENPAWAASSSCGPPYNVNDLAEL